MLTRSKKRATNGFLKKYILLFAHLCKSFSSDLNKNSHLSKHLEAPKLLTDTYVLKLLPYMEESSSYAQNHIAFPSSSNCLLAIHGTVEIDVIRAHNSICATICSLCVSEDESFRTVKLLQQLMLMLSH